MAILIETRGPRFGKCNICGSYGKLTEDHTPPKSCVNIGQVELHHIVEHLNIERSRTKGRLSQNGVKYRTLCGRCNTAMLGAKYDPTLIEFVNSIGSYLRSSLHLPPVTLVKTKPQRLMRAILGHLSAQGVDRYEKGPITEPLKEYFLDETKPLPSLIRVYFWPYPFKSHVMARDCGYLDTRLQEHVSIWFLKFFPVAFLVTFDEPPVYQFSLGCLSQWGQGQIDHEVEVSVNIQNMPPQYWPEAPTPDSVVIYGQDAIVSFDWKKLVS